MKIRLIFAKRNNQKNVDLLDAVIEEYALTHPGWFHDIESVCKEHYDRIEQLVVSIPDSVIDDLMNPKILTVDAGIFKN